MSKLWKTYDLDDDMDFPKGDETDPVLRAQGGVEMEEGRALVLVERAMKIGLTVLNRAEEISTPSICVENGSILVLVGHEIMILRLRRDKRDKAALFTDEDLRNV